MTENMSVAAIVATIVSLLLEWFPGLNTWWDGFTEAQKRGIMAAIVAGVFTVGPTLTENAAFGVSPYKAPFR